MKNQKQKSFKEVLTEIEDPNYQGGSWALPENATPSEKAKYELCEKILGYQEDNNLSDEELRKKTGLSQEKLENILFTRIEKVNSDELINVVSKLFAPCEVEITIKKNKSVHVRTV
jgi:predicted XRE-type DNA-binding protein